MRAVSSTVVASMLVRTLLAVLLIASVGSRAEAQLCGDADGSGDVSVSDCVNVLRAAVGLPTTCAVAARCDVDADGSLTVVDAVNVLRTAVGLPAVSNCACSPESPCTGVEHDVETTVSDMFPLLADESLLTGGAFQLGDPCPDGGSADLELALATQTVTLHGCTRSQTSRGHFRFDGTVVDTFPGDSQHPGSLQLEFSTIDLDHANRSVQVSGTLTTRITGSSIVVNGPLTITTPEGISTVSTMNLIIPIGTNGVVPDLGSVSFEDDHNHFTVQSIVVTPVRGSDTVDLAVTFDDSSLHLYTLNLTTGRLIRTS